MKLEYVHNKNEVDLLKSIFSAELRNEREFHPGEIEEIYKAFKELKSIQMIFWKRMSEESQKIHRLAGLLKRMIDPGIVNFLVKSIL